MLQCGVGGGGGGVYSKPCLQSISCIIFFNLRCSAIICKRYLKPGAGREVRGNPLNPLLIYH